MAVSSMVHKIDSSILILERGINLALEVVAEESNTKDYGDYKTASGQIISFSHKCDETGLYIMGCYSEAGAWGGRGCNLYEFYTRYGVVVGGDFYQWGDILERVK